MRRCVLILPGLFGTAGAPSVVRARPRPGLAQIRERAEVHRLRAPEGLPDAAYLGLNPARVGSEPGPLTVAALGVDPPRGSVHFQLSILTLAESGEVMVPEGELSAIDQRALFEATKRLNTRVLTAVEGQGWDHALVWEEGSLEHRTTPPREIQSLRQALPEGDGETRLRAYIDDSVNLLSELELNRIRAEEGLPPLNLLWPWGGGWRPEVPNLALNWGFPADVFGARLQLAGLARLAGFRPAGRAPLGKGLPTRFEWLRSQVRQSEACIVVLDTFEELRAADRLDEMDWFLAEMETRFLVPLLEDPVPTRWSVLGPGGLGMESSDFPNALPFDERALEEPGPFRDVATWVAAGLRL